MPIGKGSVTFARYRVEPLKARPKDVKSWLTKALRVHAFTPIDRTSDEDKATGFVEIEDHDAVEFSAGSLFHAEWALFAWRIDRLKVPAAAVRAELERWQKAFELENERKPGRREKAEMRGQIQHELRARANPSSKVIDLSWNLETDQLLIWASSRNLLDEIGQLVERAFSVRLVASVPLAVAAELGIEDAELKPTPALAWAGFEGGARSGPRAGELGSEEVAHG